MYVWRHVTRAFPRNAEWLACTYTIRYRRYGVMILSMCVCRLWMYKFSSGALVAFCKRWNKTPKRKKPNWGVAMLWKYMKWKSAVRRFCGSVRDTRVTLVCCSCCTIHIFYRFLRQIRVCVCVNFSVSNRPNDITFCAVYNISVSWDSKMKLYWVERHSIHSQWTI